MSCFILFNYHFVMNREKKIQFFLVFVVFLLLCRDRYNLF
jgi:hypothetical protein